MLQLDEKDAARFWSNVLVVDDANSCWPWQAALDTKNYGVFQTCVHGIRRLERAHRVAYYFSKGKLTEGLEVLQTCDNTLCVRPSHLYEGSQTDNNNDCPRSLVARARGGIAQLG